MRLFIDGRWQNVKVDHYFPTIYDKFKFSKAHNGKIWVPLIEKAFAKVHKSYGNIESRASYYALQAFTGAPCEWITEDDHEKKDIK